MEVYISKDERIFKYVHDDGSETAIKLKPVDTSDGQYGKVDNKFSVFISSSVGCAIGCEFCYLSTKDFGYHNLTDVEIVTNIKEAVRHFLDFEPKYKEYYMKLSWMGMGEPLLDFHKTIEVTSTLLSWIEDDNICKGLDCIDIGTTMPAKVHKTSFLAKLQLLRKVVKYHRNIINPHRWGRTPIRIFYSLHAGTQETRNKLIPNYKGVHTIENAIDILGSIPRKDAIIAFHQIFFDRVNDSSLDIPNIINIVNSLNAELRVLRYNKCDKAIFSETESLMFDLIIKALVNQVNYLKIQASPGSEVSASCGQFLMKKMNNPKQKEI